MNDVSSGLDPLVPLAEEFAERHRRGERPTPAEYADRYPELAERIRDLFPALAAIEQAGAAPAGPPRRLGDFRLLREVGRGGMGVVYEAEQISLKRRVAVKVLPASATADPRQLQRFMNEARAAASLHHEHIVPVHGIGEEGGVHFYAMQFIDGHTLAALIDRLRGPVEGRPSPAPPQDATTDYAANTSPHNVPPSAFDPQSSPLPVAHFRRAAEWGAQAADALEHAHGLGIVHRDVKPGNLMADGQGKLWVTDFGLARAAGDSGLTLTGDVLGTLRYMSPEQARARHGIVDHRTDVYSLGVTLYELLTLRPAFAGSGRADLLRQVAFEEPRPPRSLSPAVPADLETVVLKAMAKEPSERYATAQELADDLRRFLKDEPIRARRPTLVQRARKWARRHRQAVATAAAALFLAAVALAGVVGGVLQERAGRLARTDEKAGEALDESARHQALGETPEALEAVAKAESAVAAGGGDEALRDRVTRRRRHLEMVLRLEDVMLEPTLWDHGALDVEGQFARVSALLAKVFLDEGIDLEKLDVAEAAARLRATTVPVECAAALDRWASVVTPRKRDRGWSKRLLAVAAAADPDPLRVRVREALGRDDVAALSQLAADSPAEGFPPNTALLLGQILVDGSKADLGLEVLRRAQRQHPGHFWLNRTLAHALEAARPPRWWEDAIRFASAALATRPAGTGGYTATLHLGTALLAKGDLPEAVAAYRRAAALRPENASGHLNLGVALRAQGKIDEAADAFHRATQVKPDDYLAHDALGSARESQGRYDEADEAYRRAIKSRPDFAPSHVNLADFRLTRGDPDGAARACDAAIEHAPDFGMAYRTKGLAHKALGQLDKAEEAFRSAIRVKHRISPRYWAAMRVGAGGYGPPEARAESGILLQEQRRFLAEVHTDLGALLHARQRFDEAADAFRAALAQNGKSAEAHMLLGGVYLRQGKTSEAIKHFRDALALRGDLSGAHFDLGRALQQQGKLESAAEHYRRAGELEPYQFWTDIQLGLVLEKLHRLPDAEAAFRRAVTRLRELTQKSSRLDLRSALGAALNNLARMLSDRGQPNEARDLLTEAISHQRAALDAAPTDPDIRTFLRNHYMHLATAHLRLGDHRAAAAAAAELPRLYPGGWQERVRAGRYLARGAALAAEDAMLSVGGRALTAQRYGDDAMTLLREAAERGWRDGAALNTGDFDFLRLRDDFQQLLGSLSRDRQP